MSSDEDQPRAISAEVSAKKRRVQRACDMCRRKKRACDGLRMSEKKCTNCIENGLACTFAGALTKRRSYVDALEARLELTEQLLHQNKEPPASVAPSQASIQWSSDSSILHHPRDVVTASGSSGPGVVLAALNIRSMNTPAPAPQGADLAHHRLIEDFSYLSINQVRDRFHGQSSGAMLVKAAVQLREDYEEKDMPWSSRRMHYWTYNPAKHRVPHVGSFVFPDPDLLPVLVDLYFLHRNLYFPVLHRPTFERSIADGLHTRDPSFGMVVLLVCAIGSRFSNDVRVQPRGAEPLRCGWEFFDQLPSNLDYLFETPTIYQLQYYWLASSFLEYSAPAACWTLIGIGIRLAQDVGAHRKCEDPPTVESELWKRCFWALVSYDRLISMALGRSCTTQHEDIDADLPIECDDEFWENEDPARAFVQPAGKPSIMTFFNCYLRLNNILSVGLKMLYGLNKSKKLLAYRDPAWAEHIVDEIESALNIWLDSIPPHLRLEPNRQNDAFFDQSVLLYCSYYRVQMTIHRPFIPVMREGEPTSLPSLAICTNAARSCSHVADISRHRKNGVPVPVLIPSVFTSGIILLLNVWSGKRTGLPPHMNSAITEVHKCMETMRICGKQQDFTMIFCTNSLHLVSFRFPITQSQLRLRPRRCRTLISVGVKTTTQCSTPATWHRLYTTQPTRILTILRTSTILHILSLLLLPKRLIHLWPHSNSSLCRPTDLGKLPVFHQHNAPPLASTSSWYPTQSPAPLGHPDFTVGAALPDNGAGNITDVFAEDPVLRGQVGTNGMSSDIMAMWANAPTSFE
ncbi:fungal-specific transcription factor domain-containing protein [Mycena albidolilacea]|uniref:Fungal-specific transcription factor domain-containing protein n=1 Tax=Mycena albidolilacea TaxID=1033008 RepID=A0AAD6ZIU2_9AGAR|nr:fungal-specific transcription factor domain-containing protein [Mycena albidolilacea]